MAGKFYDFLTGLNSLAPFSPLISSQYMALIRNLNLNCFSLLSPP
jgi:hypothetical protein